MKDDTGLETVSNFSVAVEMEYSSVGKTVQVLINGAWTEGFIDE
jgi:hypothetical protein